MGTPCCRGLPSLGQSGPPGGLPDGSASSRPRPAPPEPLHPGPRLPGRAPGGTPGVTEARGTRHRRLLISGRRLCQFQAASEVAPAVIFTFFRHNRFELLLFVMSVTAEAGGKKITSKFRGGNTSAASPPARPSPAPACARLLAPLRSWRRVLVRLPPPPGPGLWLSGPRVRSSPFSPSSSPLSSSSSSEPPAASPKPSRAGTCPRRRAPRPEGGPPGHARWATHAPPRVARAQHPRAPGHALARADTQAHLDTRARAPRAPPPRPAPGAHSGIWSRASGRQPCSAIGGSRGLREAGAHTMG